MAKWIETVSDDDHEDSEEEALSLCDLPIKFTITEDEAQGTLVRDDVDKQDDSEFDFGWWGNNYTNSNMNGSAGVSSVSQMSAADELFFNGKILPLRHSDNPLLRSMSRSDSLDHSSVNRFISSRSSSIGSHYSSASSSNSSSIHQHISTRRPNNPSLQKPKFPIHSRPKPQTIHNVTNYQRQNPRMTQPPPYSSKSTVWDFFRTGLVRGPEIELHDLSKLRGFQTSSTSTISRNASKNSDVTTSNIKSSRNGFFHRVCTGSGFLSGGNCKCSVDTVLPTTETLLTGKISRVLHSRDVADKEGTLLVQYSKKKVTKKENVKMEKSKEKEAMSRRRASEWLKELSLSRESICRSNENEMGKRMISRVP